MIIRQEEDLKKYEIELEHEISDKPKDSSEMLNLKKIEESLAK